MSKFACEINNNPSSLPSRVRLFWRRLEPRRVAGPNLRYGVHLSVRGGGNVSWEDTLAVAEETAEVQLEGRGGGGRGVGKVR